MLAGAVLAGAVLGGAVLGGAVPIGTVLAGAVLIGIESIGDAWAVEGERIRHALRIGERVAIHCYAGLGRTGMIAARILVELGVTPSDAIARVRADNRRRIQTKGQARFVRRLKPLDGPAR